MTEHQINFLLQNFFKHNTNISNWEGVARTLIEDSTCILAGTENPWKGGIGNFIKTEEAPPGTIGCIRLIFNKKDFFQWFEFKRIQQNAIDDCFEKVLELNKKQQEITQLC